jgi:TolB-like protein
LKTFSFIIFIIVIINSGCAWQDQSVSDSPSMFQNNTFNQISNNNTPELDDYVRELVADMAINMKSIEQTNAIAVTSFVFSNSSYESTNNLGHVLADSFMKELHQFGLTTIDFKVTDFIRITPQGDFSLSRDYLDLKDEIPADYVLVGTMTDYNKGYILQARIVNIISKEILATGQTFIPYKIVNMLTDKRDRQRTEFMTKVSS